MNYTLVDTWKFFNPFLKPYKIRLIGLLIFPIIWCLAETIAPYLIKSIIDTLSARSFNGADNFNIIIFTVIFYGFLMLVLEFSIRSCNYLWIKTFPYIRSDIQSKVFELTQSQPFHFIYNQFAGDLINKYRNLNDGFEKMFKIFLYGFYPTLLSFFFALGFIFIISRFFSIVFLVWFIVMNLVTFLFFTKNIVAAKNESRAQNHLMGHIGDFICNAITMMSFPRALSEQGEFRCLVEENIASTQKLEFVTFKADVWRSISSWFFLVSMIIFLSVGWQKTWITLGDFSFIGTVCFYVRRSIWMTALQFSEFFKELGVVQEALSLVSDMEKNHEEVRSEIKTNALEILEASLSLDHVCFGYTKDKMLFKDLNLQIPAGQKLGILGNSGVGKTTLIQLILRLYDPIEGKITINGQNCQEFKLRDLRDLFSYVPQGGSLLHRSIFDNIAFGKPNASKDEIYEAARLCLCDEFVPFLEMGYDTIVGEDGYNLSGGQCQRIALARAYLKKAPIFLLDEVTSGLDPDLEKRLLENLCENLKSHTIILISHRPLALMKMDRVLELNEGQIIFDDFSYKVVG